MFSNEISTFKCLHEHLDRYCNTHVKPGHCCYNIHVITMWNSWSMWNQYIAYEPMWYSCDTHVNQCIGQDETHGIPMWYPFDTHVRPIETLDPCETSTLLMMEPMWCSFDTNVKLVHWSRWNPSPHSIGLLIWRTC